MCLTTEIFALFLNLIGLDMIETAPGRIIVSADTRDAHWVAFEDEWCTMAPQIDDMRLKEVYATR